MAGCPVRSSLARQIDLDLIGVEGELEPLPLNGDLLAADAEEPADLEERHR